MLDAALFVFALSQVNAASSATSDPSTLSVSTKCVISTPGQVLDALAWVEASRDAVRSDRPLWAVKHGLFLARRSLVLADEVSTPLAVELLLASALDHVDEAGDRLADGHPQDLPLLLTRAEAALRVASELACSAVFDAVESLEAHTLEGQALSVGIAARTMLERIDPDGPVGLADALVILYRLEFERGDANAFAHGVSGLMPILAAARSAASRQQDHAIDGALRRCRSALAQTRGAPTTLVAATSDVHEARLQIEAAIFDVPLTALVRGE